jgi:hypothetical protein
VPSSRTSIDRTEPPRKRGEKGALLPHFTEVMRHRSSAEALAAKGTPSWALIAVDDLYVMFMTSIEGIRVKWTPTRTVVASLPLAAVTEPPPP